MVRTESNSANLVDVAKLRSCGVEGCNNLTGKPGTALGLCSGHYHKLRRHGDAEPQGVVYDLSIEDAAYAAGFMDGEGSFMIERSKSQRALRGIRHVPRVTAANTKREPLDFLAEIFGGNVNLVRRTASSSPTCADVYVWSVTGQRAIEIARALMPYLKIKGLQAYLLSCFEYEAVWSKGGAPDDNAMPDEEFQRREELRAEIREYNRRGPDKYQAA